MDNFELGQQMAPIIIGIIGFLIGMRIYKNQKKEKLKEEKEQNEVDEEGVYSFFKKK